MMQKCVYFIAAMLLVFNGDVLASSNSSVEDAYYEFLFTRYGQQGWSKMEPGEVRDIYGDSSAIFEDFRFQTRFSLEGANSIVIFTFAKPVLAPSKDFCRSRVFTHQFYNYQPEVSLISQPMTSLRLMELVSFESKSIQKNCSVDDLSDLGEYVRVTESMPDLYLMQLWNWLSSGEPQKSDSSCTPGDNAKPMKITVGESGDFGSGNSYVAFYDVEEGNMQMIISVTEEGFELLECGIYSH